MRVKVRVADLVAKAEDAKRRAKLDHDRAKAKHDAELKAYSKRVAALLRRKANDIERGTKPFLDSYGHCRLGLPDGPRKPVLDTSRVDRDLRVLRACADETISIATDDNFARYL